MQDLTNDRSKDAPVVRDAYVMAPAQYIKWAGREVLALVRKPGDPELEKRLEKERSSSRLPPFQLGRTLKDREEERERTLEKSIEGQWPYSSEEWDSWKNGFRAAASNEMYSERSRQAAKEAGDLMDSQENGVREKVG